MRNTIREIYDTDKIDLAFHRIEHKMNFFISLDDDLYNTFLELYDKPLSYITCHKLNLINGMIHIIQGIMDISFVLYDRSFDYEDDILCEAKKELEKIVEDRLAMYKSYQEPEPEEPDFTVEDIAGGFQLERGCKAIGIDNPIVDMYPLHLSEVTDEDIVIIEELRELMCELDEEDEEGIYCDQVCEAIIELNTLLSSVYRWRQQNIKR